MSWNIIILLVIIGINLVYGLFRGVKKASIRLATVTVSLAVSIGLAVLLQHWTKGFEFLNLFNTESEQVKQIVQWINGLIPLNASGFLTNLLSKILFMDSCSIVVALLIFVIVNKLSYILYQVLAGLHGTAEKIKDKKAGRFRITNSGLSTFFGAVIGVLQGIVFAIVVYAPMCEIVAHFSELI